MALISIVVPVLDEEQTLPTLLDHLAALPGELEVVIVDGGSRDRTVSLAQARSDQPPHPRLINARRGRARQLNDGARHAHGDVLLFMHADSTLPHTAHRSVCEAISDPSVIGGNFALRFDGNDRFSRVLTVWYALQRRLGIYYGDSSIWVRRSTFASLGGFCDLAIMEDYDFARRMKRAGATVCLPGPATTSPRRWHQLGLARTVAAWIVIRWLFLAGVPPNRLARLYPNPRSDGRHPTGHIEIRD